MIIKRIKKILDFLTEKRLTTVAGAWVFFFLTSVVPLLFLLITAFGVFGVSITREFVSRLPEEFRTTGEAIATTAENATKGTTIFFVFTVVFSCTTLLKQMSKDGDNLYGIDAKHKRGFLRRVWAFMALGALFSVFLGAAFLFAFGNMLFAHVGMFKSGKLFLTTLAFTLAISFSYVIIILLNKFISPVRLSFRQVGLGGIVSLFIIVLGTIGFTLYLRIFGAYNAFYGSLAAVVVFLLWAYILMLGLVTGVIVNTKVYDHDLKNYKLSKKGDFICLKSKILPNVTVEK